jgi:hypothetical protein
VIEFRIPFDSSLSSVVVLLPSPAWVDRNSHDVILYLSRWPGYVCFIL